MISKTLDHIEHLEDLLFTKGEEGQSYINALFDYLPSAAAVRLKWDGSPSIVFGYDDENRFFVSTKSDYFRKDGPIRCYDNLDVARHHRDGSDDLKVKLILAKNHLRDLPWQHRLYHADILYTASDVNKWYGKTVEFRTNTLRYSIPSDGALGEAVLTSSIGIVVHSYYDNEGIPHPCDEIYEHDAVVMFPTKIDMNSIPRFNNRERISTLSAQEGMFDIRDDHLEYGSLLKSFANHCLKTGETLDYWTFSDFITMKGVKTITALKTRKAKDRHFEEYQKIFNHIDERVVYYSHLFQTYRAVQYTKDLWLKNIGQAYQDVRCYIDETEFPHEGVVVHYLGSTVKMVNRETFSKANFARFDK
jgi:hypothetical protein